MRKTLRWVKRLLYGDLRPHGCPSTGWECATAAYLPFEPVWL